MGVNWKGGKSCCCGACHTPPRDPQLADREIQPDQQFCCACVPKQACISAFCYPSGEETVVRAYYECDRDEEGTFLYRTTLPINGESHELIFRFKIENNVCYLCLDAPTLGLEEAVPYNCQIIDAEQRAAPNFFCQHLFIDGLPASWLIPGGTGGNPCQDLDLYIELTAASNTPIEGRKHCLDEYGNLVEDSHPIRDLCGGCGCICTCACITVVNVGQSVDVSLACLGGDNPEYDPPESWVSWRSSGPYPVTVTLTADYHTGCCQLELDTGSVNVNEIPEPVVIGGVDSNCIGLHVTWELINTSTQEPFIVIFECANCIDCSIIPSGCCDGKLPRTLTAVITGGASCSCASGSYTLYYDRLVEGWVGTVPFCSGEAVLGFFCSGYQWSLTFSADPCVIVGGGMDSVSSDCSPLSVEFNFQISGVGCCDSLSGIHDITITITE